MAGSPEERFYANVVAGLGGCWMWTATRLKNHRGEFTYGRFSVDDRDTLAHRWSYEHHVGPIPTGLILDHTCTVKRCVNPSHLETVTNAENIRRVRERSGACRNGHPLRDEAAFYVTPSTGARSCALCKLISNRSRVWSAA